MSNDTFSAEFCPSCRKSVAATTSECVCGFQRPGRGWPTDPYIGRMVDAKYRIERRLGAGGMGAVFLAKQMHGQTELGKVVLKFLLGEHLHNPSIRNRFVNEARAARQIASPHVVKVFDLGFDEDGAPFMVLEHLQGTSLAAVLQSEGRLHPDRAVGIALQIAEAMEECHQKQILHRDLKPANILLQPQRIGDFVKVLDFGIARVPQPDGQMTSTLMGTPRYMPPEQIMMRDIDAGVDIFALGVILFEMIAGEPPILATTPYEYVQLNVTASPRRLDAIVGGMPPLLVDLLDRMLAKERSRRPASMGELFAELRTIASGTGWLAESASVGRAVTPIRPHLPGPEEEPHPIGSTTRERPVPARGQRRRLVVVVAAALALLIAAAGVALRRNASEKPEGSAEGTTMPDPLAAGAADTATARNSAVAPTPPVPLVVDVAPKPEPTTPEPITATAPPASVRRSPSKRPSRRPAPDPASVYGTKLAPLK